MRVAKQRILASNCEINHHWHDLIQEPVDQCYDWIVMNPPFHTGRAAEPQLGQRLIRVAAQSLKKGGRLRLVANRNLPYESVLAESFGKFELLAEERGFKVVEARKQ